VANRKAPTAIDLFSGAGGLSLGLRWAGFRVIGAVEVDALAAETYRVNFRGIRLWETDIKSLPIAQIRREVGLKPGELDLLAGCPPCQGFSSLRSLNGHQRVKDQRNDLVLEFDRFVRGLRPKAVMLENVPALATDRRLKRLTKSLESMGYVVNIEVLDVSAFGVPQRRRRMILVAGRNRSIALAAGDDVRRTVRQTIGALPTAGKSGDKLHDVPERRAPEVYRMIERIPKNGGSRLDLGASSQLECHREFDGFKDVYGRMAWDDVSPTITGGCVNPSKGRFLHPSKNRSITLREAALLQGFPADFKFSLRKGKFAAAEMIGNALPPEFVKRHAREIKKHLADSDKS
jgi:DNA (cytosine-5)-methyltransferase 1